MASTSGKPSWLIVPDLFVRKDLLEITAASRDQLKGGRNVWKLMGVADAPKFKSSMEYFYKIAKDMGDKELEGTCPFPT